MAVAAASRASSGVMGDYVRWWRYELVEVWGSMGGRLEVGGVIVDSVTTPPADDLRQWDVFDARCGEVTGGFVGRPVEEYSGRFDPDTGRPSSAANAVEVTAA